MNDELTTAVKEAVTGVHMTIPAEQIVRRSRAIRARRQVPALAAALAVTTAAVVAVTSLVPGPRAGGAWPRRTRCGPGCWRPSTQPAATSS